MIKNIVSGGLMFFFIFICLVTLISESAYSVTIRGCIWYDNGSKAPVGTDVNVTIFNETTSIVYSTQTQNSGINSLCGSMFSPNYYSVDTIANSAFNATVEAWDSLNRYGINESPVGDDVTEINVTIDASSPSELNITQVETDLEEPWYDVIDDDNTDINLTVNEDARCRWSDTRKAYANMVNDCLPDSFNTTIHCIINDALTQGNYTRYIACNDTNGNANDASQATEINFTVDWNDPPNSPMLVSIINNTGEHSFNVSFNTTDPDNNIVSCRIYYSNSSTFSSFCVIDGTLTNSSGVYFCNTTITNNSICGLDGCSLVYFKVEYSDNGIIDDLISTPALSTNSSIYQNKFPDQPPVINNIYITPSEPKENQDLVCNYDSISDPEGDIYTISYDWYNGSHWIGYNNNTFPSSNTTIGQNWSCKINVTDVCSVSNYSISSQVTVEDGTPPNITLISEEDGYYTGYDFITLTCNATDNHELNNITLYVWNSSDMIYYNSTQSPDTTTYTQNSWYLDSMLIDHYHWNCYACDSNNNCAWAIANWNFEIQYPNPSFTITIPGGSPIGSNESLSSAGYTLAMEFSTLENDGIDLEPCVNGTTYCQNSYTPFFNFTNTGNVNNSWIIQLTSDLPSVFNLRYNTTYNPSTTSSINTTEPVLIVDDICRTCSKSLWLWADFIHAYPKNSTIIEMIHNGTMS